MKRNILYIEKALPHWVRCHPMISQAFHVATREIANIPLLRNTSRSFNPYKFCIYEISGKIKSL